MFKPALRFFYLTLFLLTHVVVLGQKIRVMDKNMFRPVYNVAVIEFDTKEINFSDEQGYVEVTNKDLSKKYIFRHPSYKRITLSYQEIKDRNHIIYLTEGILNIDEVVVSANKWEQDKSEVANEIVSISPKDAEFKNPQTAADLLESTGQIFVQRSQLGGGSPMIRGFAANSVLIMIDGVRMNNAIFRNGNLQNVNIIDPNLLERTEVIYGPGSVLYGSDALGGVMSFNSVGPKYSTGKNIDLNTTAFSRYSSANQEKTSHINLRYGNQNWGFITGLTYSDYNDLRSGSNRNSKYPEFGKRAEYAAHINGTDVVVPNSDQDVQRFSGYDQTNFLQKIGYTKNATEIRYGFYLTTSSNIPRYDRLIERTEGTLKNAEWFYGPQKFTMHTLSISNFKSNKLYDAVNLVLAHQRVTESRHDRPLFGTELRVRKENVKTYSLNVDFDKKVGESSEIFYGAEVLHNQVNSEAYTLNIANFEDIAPAATRYPDGGSRYGSIAAYFNFKQKFFSNLIVNAGLRYSNVFLSSSFLDKTFYNFPFSEIRLNNDAISGSLSLIYSKDSKWKASILLSSGFRSPNVDDVGKVFDSEPGNVVVPNEQLSPEFSYNCEIGLTRNIANIIELEAVGYYSLLNQAIVRRDFTFNGSSTIVYDGVESNVEALVNVGDAFIYGYSVSLRAELNKNMSLSSTLSNNDGEDTIDNLPLRHTAPMFGQTSFIFNVKRIKSEIFARYNGPRYKSDFAPSELNKDHLYTVDGSPSWMTFNVRSSFQLAEGLLFNAALENIFDVHYRPYSSGISAAGRNVILSLKAQF